MNRSAQMISLALLVAASTFALTTFSSDARGTRTAIEEPSNIGSVDVFALIDIGIMTEDQQAARDEYTTQGDLALNPLYAKDAELQSKLNAMDPNSFDPNDPMGNQLYQQYQQNLNQLQQLSQQINSGYQRLIANQIAGLYTKVYGAANEVASENGYSYVFVTRPNSDLLQTDTIQGVTQEILARPLVTPPASTDLTELVRQKLGFPTMEEIDAANAAKAEELQKQADDATDAAQDELEDATQTP